MECVNTCGLVRLNRVRVAPFASVFPLLLLGMPSAAYQQLESVRKSERVKGYLDRVRALALLRDLIGLGGSRSVASEQRPWSRRLRRQQQQRRGHPSMISCPRASAELCHAEKRLKSLQGAKFRLKWHPLKLRAEPVSKGA